MSVYDKVSFVNQWHITDKTISQLQKSISISKSFVCFLRHNSFDNYYIVAKNKQGTILCTSSRS